MGHKTALIAGASGLVGSELLQCLLASQSYQKVVVLVRKPLTFEHPLMEQLVVDFDQLHTYTHLLQVDDVFCCLGTTIKKAKTQDAMRKIDYGYPLELARLTLAEGATQYLIISSMGADPESNIFYSRLKGEVERDLAKQGFPSLQIFRPSLLLGEREEFRVGERLAATLAPIFSLLFRGSLKKYQAIEARTVARGMYEVAQKGYFGTKIYLSDEIAEIGEASTTK